MTFKSQFFDSIMLHSWSRFIWPPWNSVIKHFLGKARSSIFRCKNAVFSKPLYKATPKQCHIALLWRGQNLNFSMWKRYIFGAVVHGDNRTVSYGTFPAGQNLNFSMRKRCILRVFVFGDLETVSYATFSGEPKSHFFDAKTLYFQCCCIKRPTNNVTWHFYGKSKS